MNRKRRFLLPVLVFTGLLLIGPFTAFAQGQKLQSPEIDACFAALSNFDYGKDLAPLRKLSFYAESLEAGSDQARALEARLVALLASNASVAAKQFACRQLGLIGGTASLAPLQRLLGEASLAEIALWALERIPESGAVLRDALASSAGPERTAVINALGRRHDAQAVSLLKPIAVDKDPAASQAAIRALGLIGTPEAAAVLAQAATSASGESRRPVQLAMLECGERLASSGQPEQAVRLFRDLAKSGEDWDIRFGALRGLSRIPEANATADLVPVIKKGDSKGAGNAIQVLLQMPGPAPVKALADILTELQPATQQAALLALAERGDAKPAVSKVVEACRSRSPEVRTAAWAALGRLGDSSHVPLLVKALLAPGSAERAAARLSLSGMNCPDFDSALLGLLKTADSDTRVEIVGIIEDRRTESAADALLSIAQEDQGELQSAALKALRRTASEKQIGQLVDLLASTPSGSPVLAETVSSLLKKSPQPHVTRVCQSYKATSDAPRRVRLIAGLRGVGDPQALNLLKEAMAAPQSEIQRAAILSVSEWPDSGPIPDLLAVARNTSLDASARTLALRGCLRLISLPSNTPHKESVALIKQVLELAPAPEEKKRALAIVENFRGPEAVALAEAASSDPALAAEAKSALEHMRAAAAGDVRLLVYTRNYASNGQVYVHDNITDSVAAIEKLGRENGFSIDVSDKPAVFTDENLAQYKAIVFSNSNNEAFENDAQRGAFQRYIRRGGGFVGVHAACASEPNWPWFWALVGGTFDFHPPFQSFTIRVLDKNHPSTAFFEKDTWSWEDEFYFLKERSDKIRVLMAGEVKSLKDRGDNPAKLAGEPDPSPLVWCQEFEGGRAWYTALGHKKEHYQDPVYLRHLRGGILWAIGKE